MIPISAASNGSITVSPKPSAREQSFSCLRNTTLYESLTSHNITYQVIVLLYIFLLFLHSFTLILFIYIISYFGTIITIISLPLLVVSTFSSLSNFLSLTLCLTVMVLIMLTQIRAYDLRLFKFHL